MDHIFFSGRWAFFYLLLLLLLLRSNLLDNVALRFFEGLLIATAHCAGGTGTTQDESLASNPLPYLDCLPPSRQPTKGT